MEEIILYKCSICGATSKDRTLIEAHESSYGNPAQCFEIGQLVFHKYHDTGFSSTRRGIVTETYVRLFRNRWMKHPVHTRFYIVKTHAGQIKNWGQGRIHA